MKKIAVLPLVVAMLMCFVAFAQSDSVVVKVSKDKVKISGKLYYIHTVREGETLYAIAKAYQIAQAAIIECNPEIYKGVKIGNTIKVPVVQEMKNPNPNKGKYHVVKKGETLYAIAKQYGVPVDVLVKVNLLDDNSVKESQQLYIPTDKDMSAGDKKTPLIESAPKAVTKPQSAKTVTHEVQPKETLYSISKKYNVTIDDIEEANPSVKQEGLKVGQSIVIPSKDSVDTASAKSTVAVKTYATGKDCPSYKYNSSTPFNVVLMLPFSLSVNAGDTVHSSTNTRKTEDILQYYQGTLLAIDSLKNSGVSVNLTVIDTKNDNDQEALAKALKNPAMQNAQLIIGPVYPTAIPVVAQFAEKNDIPMVSPLATTTKEIKDNPYLIQVATDAELIQNMSLEYARKHVNGQTILVYSSDGTDSKLVKDFKAALKVKLPEITYRQGGNANAQREALRSKLLSDKKNRFIVLSNNEVFVLDFLQNLSIASKGQDVEVLGTPRWLKFTSIDMQYIHGSNVEIYVPNYVDYTEAGAKAFTQDFRNFYKTEPNNYAFRGFDVAFFFIDVMRHHGPDFLGCLPNISKQNIHTPFHFKKVDTGGGYVNTEAVLIKHTDGFRVIKVK